MKNKIKNFALSAGVLGTSLVPIAAVVSCNDVDNGRILTIQAEKAWIPFYKEIVKKFKTDYAQEMSDSEIDDIKIIEHSSTTAKDTISKKGIRDEALADVFLVQSDVFNSIKQYLKKYTNKTFAKFASSRIQQLGNIPVTLSKPARTTQDSVQDLQSMYGVVQNVEGLVKLQSTTLSTTPQMITNFSDLWFSVGFFNEEANDGFNLKDIVETNDEGTIVDKTKTGTNEDKILAGFKRILTHISKLEPKLKDVTALNTLSSEATPIVLKYFKDNVAKTSIITGPWGIKEGKLEGQSVKASSLTGYNQWGGGYLFVLNKRINKGEQKIGEMLIATLLNPENAVQIFKNINKISPLKEGAEKIAADTKELTNSQRSLAGAITKLTLKNRPTDDAFGPVWGSYASTMHDSAAEIIAVASKGIDALAEQLKDNFIKAVQASVTAGNNSNN